MTNWIIGVYHPLSNTTFEFDMESDTKPTREQIINELEFFAEFDNPVHS